MSTDAADTDELLEAAVEAVGGTYRDGQHRMAKAVTHALDSQRHLAVQAGTGTGKSLAYLVPSIRHALNSGTAVIVSTATLALQRQLIERDLPQLAEALAPHLQRRPTFAIMKGRSNYVCQNKLAQADIALTAEDDAPGNSEEMSAIGAQVARIHEWAEDTDTGDREDLEHGVSDLAWRQVSVTAQECLGASRCPQGDECFAEHARARAQGVDIVVTNHALLAIDALADIDIIPEHDCVIVDEAHELDARITSATTAEISPRSLTMAANRATKLGADSKDKRLKELADEWSTTASTLDAGRWTDLDEPSQAQLVAIRDALVSLRETIGPAPEGEASNDPESAAERQNLRNHLTTLVDALQRIVDVFATDDPAAQSDVVWLERSERFGDTLAVAPLSVAGLLRERLFSENTVVLTSATLTLGGRFDAMAAQWGLAKNTWDSLDAGTPFDPQSSGILYTPRHLPPPGREGLAPETISEIKDLTMAAGGRTLGLFSSRRAAEQAAEELRPYVPFDVLVQGEDSLGALVERFSNNEHTVLFGTLSLWQGVDVPGKSCSLVIIDRIPFPRPDNPLLQARSEAAKAAGRNGFMEVSATHAALLLAQGAGRLLRSVDDRGVIAILDNRIVTKRYGAFLRDSLPPFWPTTDHDTVIGALKRVVQR